MCVQASDVDGRLATVHPREKTEPWHISGCHQAFPVCEDHFLLGQSFMRGGTGRRPNHNLTLGYELVERGIWWACVVLVYIECEPLNFLVFFYTDVFRGHHCVSREVRQQRGSLFSPFTTRGPRDWTIRLSSKCLSTEPPCRLLDHSIQCVRRAVHSSAHAIDSHLSLKHWMTVPLRNGK